MNIKEIVDGYLGQDGELHTVDFSFSSKTFPPCKDFLFIRKEDEEKQSIEDFILKYPNITNEELENCFVEYREIEKRYKTYNEECLLFSESLKFVNYYPKLLCFEQNIKAVDYFIQKSAECLQFARFFAIKSKNILDYSFNLNWSGKYTSQYIFRCLYFSTASTWYSNCFDQILQALYWGMGLYKNHKKYSESWNKEEINSKCTYKFVKNQVKNTEYDDLYQCLINCYDEIKQVRKWANFIKHKGGIDYKFLEPVSPAKIFLDLGNGFEQIDFKSDIEVDIDEGVYEFLKTHNALFNFINQVICFFGLENE